MKTWKKVVGVIGIAALFVLPGKAGAEDLSRNYVQFANTDALESLRYKNADFISNKHVQQVEKFEEEYRLDERKEEATENYYSKQEELTLLHAALDEKLGNDEITEEEYELEREKVDQLMEQLSEKYDQELEELHKGYEDGLENLRKMEESEMNLLDVYGLISKESILTVEEIDLDWDQKYNNIAGFEKIKNLKVVTGEYGASPILDIRPFRSLTLLESVSTEASGIINLDDFKNNQQLSKLKLRTAGNTVVEERYDNRRFSQPLLTDISALSDLKNLKQVSIQAEGVMLPVTLKKGTSSYQLYDPIILSSQFDGAQITYRMVTDEYEVLGEDHELLQWDNLTGTEEYLSFEFTVSKGNFYFEGEGQIPLRWK